MIGYSSWEAGESSIERAVLSDTAQFISFAQIATTGHIHKWGCLKGRTDAMPPELPADRLKEIESKMLTTADLALQDYRPLTDGISVFYEWECLQRIVSTLKRSKAKWGYRNSNPYSDRGLQFVEVWRLMPNDLLSADTERHRRAYQMKKHSTNNS